MKLLTHMRRYRPSIQCSARSLRLVVLFASVIFLFSYTSLYAVPPATHIRVEMLRLTNTGAIQIPRTYCVPNDTSVGCTANAAIGVYPFGTATTPTVEIDGNTTSPYNRYLLDVIPNEMSPNLFQNAAVYAQAIAARTYAYFFAQSNVTINNSNEKQVFVPWTYENLSAANKSVISNAVASRNYLTMATSSNAIFSEFFADISLTTVEGDYSYLKAVPDPISSHPDVVMDGHGRGLSQKGAGRWARGTSSYQCYPGGACTPPPSQPHFKWSVLWSNSNQILTHYFTGIHVRDENRNIQTAQNRWVPLSLQWNTGDVVSAPMFLCSGQSVSVVIWLQNTGTTAWQSNAASVIFRGDNAQETQAIVTQSLSPGETATVTLNFIAPTTHSQGTPYEYRFDMKISGQYFSSQQPSWPMYITSNSLYLIPNCTKPPVVYLPLLQSTGVTQ